VISTVVMAREAVTSADVAISAADSAFAFGEGGEVFEAGDEGGGGFFFFFDVIGRMHPFERG
jgi:hypothetical protein